MYMNFFKSMVEIIRRSCGNKFHEYRSEQDITDNINTGRTRSNFSAGKKAFLKSKRDNRK